MRHVAFFAGLVLTFLQCALLRLVVAEDSSNQVSIFAFATGATTNCALIDETRQLKCFGQGSQGRLGNGSTNHIGDNGNEMGNNQQYVDLNFTEVISHCVGSSHACAVGLPSYELKCWGDAGNGRIGSGGYSSLGDTPNEMGAALLPVRIGVNYTAKSVSCGTRHSCVVLDDGKIKCFGSNEYGQLGLGSVSSIGSEANKMGDKWNVTEVGTNKTVKQLALGNDHTCAILSDDSLRCWGSNIYGQLGRPRLGDQRIGDQLLEMGDVLEAAKLGEGLTAKQVCAGGYHSCAILNNGSVKCWGRNARGQLGLGHTTHKGLELTDMGDYLPPVFLGENRTALDISCGEQVTCAVLDDHSVKCWGDGSTGQLMHGNTTHIGTAPGDMEELQPINLGSRTYQVVSVHAAKGYSLNGGHVCVTYSPTATAPGRATCWGTNYYGQLGAGNTVNYGSGAGQTGNDTIPVQVDLGNIPTHAPTVSPTMLREPTTSPTTSQPSTSPTTSKPSQAPSYAPSWSPTTSTPTASPYVQVRVLSAALSMRSTCAILEYRKIKCFGDSIYGRLGNGNSKDDLGKTPSEMGNNLPLVDLGLNEGIRQVSQGQDHVCAVSMAGRLKCWGFGYNGQLGLARSNMIIGDDPNEMGTNLSVVDLGPGASVREVSLGGSFTCALMESREIKCFGSNGDGQLGIGSTSGVGSGVNDMGANLTSVMLGTNVTAKQVSAGYAHVCAILHDDSVKCWGLNDNGQLGRPNGNGWAGVNASIGDAPNEMGENLTTIELGTNKTAKQVCAGGSHSCAILNDDSVKCWGKNNRGQLGLGNMTNRGANSDMGDLLPPVYLGFNRTALSIACGDQVTCAVLDDHSVKCWGDGSNGQLMKGNITVIGSAPGDMEELTPINLGSRTHQVASVYLSKGSSYGHACAIFSPSASLPGYLTCWGKGQFGQRGTGDLLDYGALTGQTGGESNPLRADLGEAGITDAPTSLPTTSPTKLPTSTPTLRLDPSGSAPATNSDPQQLGIIVGTSVAFGLVGLAFGLFVFSRTFFSRQRPNRLREGVTGGFMLVPLTKQG